jgi:CDP-paratose 2-epimerase
VVFTSTNKVYGDLSDIKLRAAAQRYEPIERLSGKHGFNEDRPLAFHSPYGCSKGAACQYVLDYARTFGVPAVVFRMSCIYGPHQFGNEDQGWVAHFLIKAAKREPITIYGDGRQVRDILFVEDLVNAFLLAQQNIRQISGQAFNIGGGPANTISLLELLDLIGQLQSQPAIADFSDWRTADQKYYVSDIRKFAAETGWSPATGVREGVTHLYRWLEDSQTVPCNVSEEGLEHQLVIE